MAAKREQLRQKLEDQRKANIVYIDITDLGHPETIVQVRHSDLQKALSGFEAMKKGKVIKRLAQLAEEVKMSILGLKGDAWTAFNTKVIQYYAASACLYRTPIPIVGHDTIEKMKQEQRVLRHPVGKQCCSVCDSTKDLKLCGHCGKIYYCSPEHQKEDWPRHKRVCIPNPKK